MTIRSTTTVALGLSVLVAAPASAATYTGTLQGVITSGTAFYSSGVAEDYVESTIPLVGKDITIDFTSDVTPNYNDVANMIFYPEYLVNSVAVKIGIPDPLGNYASTQSNDYDNIFGWAGFSGSAATGSFRIGGINGDVDFRQYVDFSFAGASSKQGPLSGSGTGSVSFFNPYYPNLYATYDVTFKLLSGFVTGPGAGVPLGTPEPATWSLMIAGFGAVGAAMRRRAQPGSTAPA